MSCTMPPLIWSICRHLSNSQKKLHENSKKIGALRFSRFSFLSTQPRPSRSTQPLLFDLVAENNNEIVSGLAYITFDRRCFILLLVKITDLYENKEKINHMKTHNCLTRDFKINVVENIKMIQLRDLRFDKWDMRLLHFIFHFSTLQCFNASQVSPSDQIRYRSQHRSRQWWKLWWRCSRRQWINLIRQMRCKLLLEIIEFVDSYPHHRCMRRTTIRTRISIIFQWSVNVSTAVK